MKLQTQTTTEDLAIKSAKIEEVMPGDLPAAGINALQVQEPMAGLPAAPQAAMPQRAEDMMFSDRWINFARMVRFSRFLPTQLRSTKDYDSTYDILMYLATARSYGLQIPAALFNKALYITVAKDGSYNVSMWVATQKAVAVEHGCSVKSWYDNDKLAAFCEITRNGVTTHASFSVQEAVTAKKMYYDETLGEYRGVLTKNGQDSVWANYWPTMLIRRAEGRALSQACPDLLMGITSADEILDATTAAVAPTITIKTANAPAKEISEIPTPTQLSA